MVTIVTHDRDRDRESRQSRRSRRCLIQTRNTIWRITQITVFLFLVVGRRLLRRWISTDDTQWYIIGCTHWIRSVVFCTITNLNEKDVRETQLDEIVKCVFRRKSDFANQIDEIKRTGHLLYLNSMNLDFKN